jgi:peptide/nickel transport system substrate-binding protein
MSGQAPKNESTEAGIGAYQRRNSSKRTLIISLAIAAVVALIAVVSVVVISANTQEPAKRALTVGLVLEPTNLNVRTTPGAALDQVLLDNVYQGLVTFKSGTLDVIPALATSYDVSEDGLTYTFELNTAATFHSGNALTVDDVVTSLTETSPLLGESFEEVGAVDESTVEIALSSPNSQLLFLLAGRAGIILEDGATNDLNNTANGTGPFLLEEWKQGDSITLSAVENYWGTAATLDTVTFRYIPDGKAAVNAMLDGDLNVQTAVLPDLQAEFENQTDISLVRAASTDVFTLAYNNAKAPLDDLRVREAISRAIDQEALIQAVIGDGLPLGGPITELELGYRDLTAINAYDPDSSRELLSDAGVDELSLTLTVPNFYGTTIPNLLVTQLAEVGITLELNVVEFATWLEQVYTNKDYDLSYIDHAEAGDFVNYANPDYYFNYNNPQVQKLFAESLAALSRADVGEKLQEASEIVANDAVAKWLYNFTPTTAIRDTVSGFPTANTNSRINLEGVTVAE